MRTRGHRYAGLFATRERVAFKNAFAMPGSGATPAAAPTPAPPPPMPDLQSPAALESARIAAQKAMQGGRSSTILTTAASRARSTIAGSAPSPGSSTYSAGKLSGAS